MNPVRKTLFLVPVAAAMLTMSSPQSVADSAGRGSVWQPTPAWEYNGLFTVGDDGVQLSYDPLLLSLGRSVYADLQEARQAALAKEATNLRVSLMEARDTIHRLRLPSQLMALDAQLRVIRNDLKDTRKALDTDLWVPVETEIDEVLVYAPEAVRAKTKEAIGKGKAAAGKGDRETASAQLDVVTSSLQYSLGAFPLDKVKRDLDAAWATASLPKPDWAGTLEAVQSALATLHWFTRIPAHSLLTAYNDVVRAYVLASGPRLRPEQKQKVLDYLAKAKKNLSNTPGETPLAEETKALIDKVDPHASDIKLLLGDLQSQIQLERQRAEDQYWDAIGHEATF